MTENQMFSRHKDIRERGYLAYVNYEALEVGYTDAIPSDYAGVMGVPISFLDKYNPDQFDIVGASLFDAIPIKQVARPDETFQQGGRAVYVRSSTDPKMLERKYFRILIHHKNPAPRTAD